MASTQPTYDFFGTPWAKRWAPLARKALEEGGWAVLRTIVDHLLAEGFSADRIAAVMPFIP